MTSQLTEITDRLGRDAQKAGRPRIEADQELMTERAMGRANDRGQHVQNKLYHGQRTGKRGNTI